MATFITDNDYMAQEQETDFKDYNSNIYIYVYIYVMFNEIVFELYKHSVNK